MEVPLSNGRFTWSRMGSDSTHSLLDRFFISKEWDIQFSNPRVVRGERVTSNHFPILIEAGGLIWCPNPFRFFNSWLKEKECLSLIETKLSKDTSCGWIDFSIFSKLRNLKSSLKQWHLLSEKKRKAKEEQILTVWHQKRYKRGLPCNLA